MKTKTARRMALSVMAGLVMTLAVPGAQAQQWPDKPIRIVSPFAAGGVGDIIFRLIAPQLEARLGQRFVIDNRTGAAGNIGTAEVVRARADGYTLLFAPTANFAVNQHLFLNLGFDPVTQLEPVTVVAEAPLVAVTSLGAPSTLKDFLAQARANPRKFNYASPGIGSPAHLAGVSFSQLSGNAMVHIGYRGAPPLVLAMMADEVQLTFATLSSVGSQLKAGKLKAIAAMSNQRNPDLPHVPTSAESGFPDLVFGNWWVLAAPAGTDARIVARLGSEVRAALADPVTKAKLAEIGQVVVGMTPAESANFIRAESTRYKTLIERNNIKPEQ